MTNNQEIMDMTMPEHAYEIGNGSLLSVQTEKYGREILRMWAMQRLTKPGFTIY